MLPATTSKKEKATPFVMSQQMGLETLSDIRSGLQAFKDNSNTNSNQKASLEDLDNPRCYIQASDHDTFKVWYNEEYGQLPRVDQFKLLPSTEQVKWISKLKPGASNSMMRLFNLN